MFASLLLLLSAAGPSRHYTGWIDAGAAVATIQVRIDSAGRVGIEGVDFSFLGAGSMPDVKGTLRGGQLRLTFSDLFGGRHELVGQAVGDTIRGTYHGFGKNPLAPPMERHGTVELVRFDSLSTGQLERFAGVYRSGGRYLQLSVVSDGFLSVFDMSSGMVRRAYPKNADSLFFGREVERPRPVGGWLVATPSSAKAGAVVLDLFGTRERSITSYDRVTFPEREVAFQSDSVRLEGTLIYPAGAGPHPAVILVQGAGNGDRAGYRRFANYFASIGVAAFIYDKRGTGKSTGDFDAATFDDLADDALAAFRALGEDSRIDKSKIGLQGASQGGWIVPLAASREPRVAFVITVSGPGMPGDAQETFRRLANLRGRGYVPAAGVGPNELAAATNALTSFYEFIRTGGANGDQLRRRLRLIQHQPWFEVLGLIEADSVPNGNWPSWMTAARSQNAFDPVAAWRAVRCPALLFFGALDVFVPALPSIPPITGALLDGGHSDFTVKLFPRGDHFMQEHDPARPRGPTATFVPEYLATLREWVRERVLQP